MIPAKIIVSIAKLRLLKRTSPNTMTKANNPLIMETIGRVKLPNPIIDTLKNKTRTAPKEAPDDTPIV